MKKGERSNVSFLTGILPNSLSVTLLAPIFRFLLYKIQRLPLFACDILSTRQEIKQNCSHRDVTSGRRRGRLGERR